MKDRRYMKGGFVSLLFAATVWCVPLSAQTAGLAELPPQQTKSVPETVAALATAEPAALWDKANTAYINADFHTAIEVYEVILAQGLSSAKLYYNLGNAYFKEGNIGKSILYYNRALRLTPGNEDVRYNLSVAEARAKDTIEQIPEFFVTTWMRSLRHVMGCTAWSVLSLVLLALTLGLLLLYLLAQRLTLRKAGFFGAGAMLLLTVATTWFALLERREILRDDEAVIMVTSTAVKSSPDRGATDLFLLHEGTKVDITDHLGDWVEITIADGKKGWVENGKIEVI